MNQHSHRFASLILLCAACFVWGCGAAWAEDKPQDSIVIDGHVHTPQEIVQLLDRSILAYTIDSFRDSELVAMSKNRERPVLQSDLYAVEDNRRVDVKTYQLTPEASRPLESGEVAFQKEDFGTAIRYYRETLAADSTYYQAYTFIGDVHYKQGQLDSAIVYYREAIRHNFIDYQAHWFLADALWLKGQSDEAVREITIAHVLNVNHQEIGKTLRSFRTESNRAWREWSYDPIYAVARDSLDQHVIDVRCTDIWLPYALVKALWQFEPKYAEQMNGGRPRDTVFEFREEQEALANFLAGPSLDTTSDLAKASIGVIKEGTLAYFLIYELLAPEHPIGIVRLPKATILQIAEYVDKYH